MLGSLKKNAIIYIGSTILSKALPFFLLPILANYLSTEEYGIVSNFTVLLLVFEILIVFNGGTFYSVSYYKVNEIERKNLRTTIFITNFLLGLVLLLGTFLLKGIVVEFVPLSSELLYSIPIVVFFYVIFRLYLDESRLSNNPLTYAFSEIIYSLVNVSLTLLLIIQFSYKAEGRVGAILITNFSFGVFALISFLKKKKIGSFFVLDKVSFLNFLKFSIPLIPNNISNWFRSGLDRYVITFYLGLGAVGIYGASFQLASVVGLILATINKAISPYVYETLSEKGDLTHQKKLIVKFSYLFLLLVVVGLIVFNIAIEFFISGILPEAYQDSIRYVWILSIAFGFQGAYFIFSNFIFFVKKSKIIAMITFSSMIFQVPLLFVLTHFFDIYGTCISFLVGNIINAVLAFFLSRKFFPMPWNQISILWNY